MKASSLIKQALTPLAWLLAIVFLIEEFVWDWTARLMSRLGALRLIHIIEMRIQSLPPRWALFAFLLPVLILVPAKLAGLHLITSGHWLIGGWRYFSNASLVLPGFFGVGGIATQAEKITAPITSIPKSSIMILYQLGDVDFLSIFSTTSPMVETNRRPVLQSRINVVS